MSLILDDDTIAAISTPIGEGGIGIVRLSGTKSISVANHIFKSKKQNFSLLKAEPQKLYYGHIVDGEHVIDEVLVSVFCSPHSYTTEDMVEISAHGGMVALRQILHLTLRYGARMAEPGEFTKRAFLNGRIDLTQAEAVLDMIRAKTDRALEAASKQLAGHLSGEIRLIKEELMKIYAHMEAYLDFPDEHLEIFENEEFHQRFQSAEGKIRSLLNSFTQGEILREGILVVIVGKPNVGKSSLLNVLLKRDRAIVSEVPGTTRDAIEESIELEGVPIRLVDTAGIFVSEEPLTKVSMEKTRSYLKEGDLFLFVLDATSGLSDEDQSILFELSGKHTIPIINKIDLLNQSTLASDLDRQLKSVPWVSEPCLVSAKTEMGIESIERAITKIVWDGNISRESAMITRLRHKHALEVSIEALQKSYETFKARESLEFVTLDLKRALDALREMVGEIYSEDLLDVIFKEFCIGK